MNRTTKLLPLLGALAALPLAVFAQSSVSTDPVGFVTLNTLSNSDTIFSTPLARPEAFRGSVGTLGSTTITASGTPGWTASAYVYAAGTQSNTYYLRFRTGAKAGCFYTVTANTTDTLTIDLAGDLLTGATAGDEFALIPYWTLGTAFPTTAAGTAFEASPNAGDIRTEILFPKLNHVGINASAASTYFYQNNAWRKEGVSLAVSFNDTPLLPDSYVVVRNQAFTGSIVVMGGVPMAPQATPLNSYPANEQDNYVALTYPVAVALKDLGLVSAGGFRASPNAGDIMDQVLVFNNSQGGINKSAAATYFYFNNGWRKLGQSLTTNFGTDLIQPGAGFVVRKGVDAAGPRSATWTFGN